MARPRGPETRKVGVILNRPTFDQLTLEAVGQGKTLSTYLRDVLQSYAPGIGKPSSIEDAARKLSATAFVLND